MKTNLTALYAGKTNPAIIGRDKEIKMLFLTLMRYEKPNAILYGEPGVGKTAIVHQLAYLIANNICPEALKGYKVIEVNTNSLLAGPGYRGVVEEKFETIIRESVNDKKTILFFDEFHTVEHLGEMANGQTPGLGNTLKPYLTSPHFRVIGATTFKEYSQMTDKALLRRFYPIYVGEPNDEAIKSIITSCIKRYGSNLSFRASVIDKLLTLSKSLNGFNPDKAKDLTDFLCSWARNDRVEVIDDNAVDQMFNYYFNHLVEKEEESVTPVTIID